MVLTQAKNIGFDLIDQGLIRLEKNRAVLFFLEMGLRHVPRSRIILEHLPAVNVCTTGTAFRVPFLICACFVQV